MSHSSSREKTARKAVKPKSKTVLPDAPELSPHAEPVASTSAVPLEPGKKKKKSKSRPAEEDEPSHAPTDRTNRSDTHVAPSDQSTEDTQRPRKKRKSKHAVAEEGTPPDDADHNSIEGSDAEAQPKKRKKRKKIVDTDETEGGGKKKSRKGKEVGETDEEPETTVVKKSKKEKKRKHRDTADEETVAGADDGPSSEAPKKKKRKRGKTGFPNPEEDESLSEQAQKALHYAYSQFDDPSSWKFHKARQNWLIRNVWSQQAIPDIYIPLLTKYLEGVQGGAREAIIKTCREVLTKDTSKPTEKGAADGEIADTNPASEQPTAIVDETNRSRATTVLAVLSGSSTS